MSISYSSSAGRLISREDSSSSLLSILGYSGQYSSGRMEGVDSGFFSSPFVQFIIISAVIFAVIFGYRQAWKSGLETLVKRLQTLAFPKGIGKEGLGEYAFIPWISIGIGLVVSYTIFGVLGFAKLTSVGLVFILSGVIAVLYRKPTITPIQMLPKARLHSSTEEFLVSLANDAGFKNVQFRIDENEKNGVYGYTCEQSGMDFTYIVFGADFLHLIQKGDITEYEQGVLAFAVAHELSHLQAGDTLIKHSILRFLFPLQGINRVFFRVKSALAGGSTPSLHKTNGRAHLGYNLISMFVSLWQLPWYIVFSVILMPFYFIVGLMEERADKNAYSLLTESKTLKAIGLGAEKAAKDYFIFFLENPPKLLRTSYFEAAMSVHGNPVERAKKQGIIL